MLFEQIPIIQQIKSFNEIWALITRICFLTPGCWVYILMNFQTTQIFGQWVKDSLWITILKMDKICIMFMHYSEERRLEHGSKTTQTHKISLKLKNKKFKVKKNPTSLQLTFTTRPWRQHFDGKWLLQRWVQRGLERWLRGGSTYCTWTCFMIPKINTKARWAALCSACNAMTWEAET